MKKPLNMEEDDDECPLCRLSVSSLETHIAHEHGMNNKGFKEFLGEVQMSRDNYLKRMVMKGMSMTVWVYALMGMWLSVMFIAFVSGFTHSFGTGVFSTSLLGIGSVLIMKNELVSD